MNQISFFGNVYYMNDSEIEILENEFNMIDDTIPKKYEKDFVKYLEKRYENAYENLVKYFSKKYPTLKFQIVKKIDKNSFKLYINENISPEVMLNVKSDITNVLYLFKYELN